MICQPGFTRIEAAITAYRPELARGASDAFYAVWWFCNPRDIESHG